MKGIKRILSLLLLVVLLLLPAGCKKDPDDVSGSLVPDSQPSQESSASTEESEDEALSIGQVNGGRYENKYFGFGCSLDSTWTYASQEQLQAQNGLTAEMFDDEALQEQLRNSNMFYDMMAATEDGYCNINVVVQNMGLLYGSILSEDTIVDQSIQALPNQMAGAGMTVTSCKAAEVEFAGAAHKAIRMASTIQDVPIYQICVFIKRGGYITNITLTSFMEDNTDTLLKLFYGV